MISILCYGDSNTWGYNPATSRRFAEEDRWVCILQRWLGTDYKIIPEGLNGRTTMRDDPFEGAHKNGLTYLPACIESHKPLDLVAVMLGTNDLKTRFSAAPIDVAQGAGKLVTIIQASDTGINGKAPIVLLIAPPSFGKLTGYADNFANGEEKSKLFDKYYRQIAELQGCYYLNAGDHVNSSPIDGIHLEAPEQRKLGEAVAKKVGEIFRG
ncbi:MAG: hydrolase [Chitinivibrionales bacterium]|nr:hydrolase [Chitinivibrionales bacterium]